MLIKNDKIIARIDETGTTDGLVAWWGLNGNLLDKSGNGNNGTWKNTGLNAPVENFVDAIPDGGKGVLFNGTNDYVDCGSKSWGLKYIKTCSFWIKKEITSNQTEIILAHYLSGLTIGIFLGNLLTTSVPVGSRRQAVLTSFQNNKFNHIVIIYDASYNPTCYINGVETAYTSILQWGGSGDTFYIGRRSSGSNFNGLIDDVRIYNRALTDKEISQLYRSFKQNG